MPVADSFFVTCVDVRATAVIDTFKIFLPPWELTGGKGNIKFAMLDVSVEVLKPLYI